MCSTLIIKAPQRRLTYNTHCYYRVEWVQDSKNSREGRTGETFQEKFIKVGVTKNLKCEECGLICKRGEGSLEPLNTQGC